MIHAATQRYFDPTPEQPTSIFEVEIDGTRRVLEFARTHGTREISIHKLRRGLWETARRS